jgi:hypothetical protein
MHLKDGDAQVLGKNMKRKSMITDAMLPTLPETSTRTYHTTCSQFVMNFACMIFASFQRPHMWTEKDEQEYLKTIFTNDCHRSITLNRRRSGEYSVIDGGHRTRTIHKFMSGKITVRLEENGNEYVYSDNKYEEKDGAPYLRKADYEAFRMRLITIVEYQNLTEDDEHEKFELINRGKPMTSGNLVNAVDNYYTRAIKKISEKHEHIIHTLNYRISNADHTLLVNLGRIFLTLNGFSISRGFERLNKVYIDMEKLTLDDDVRVRSVQKFEKTVDTAVAIMKGCYDKGWHFGNRNMYFSKDVMISIIHAVHFKPRWMTQGDVHRAIGDNLRKIYNGNHKNIAEWQCTLRVAAGGTNDTYSHRSLSLRDVKIRSDILVGTT